MRDDRYVAGVALPVPVNADRTTAHAPPIRGALRTVWPPSAMHGFDKLVLLVAYLVLSAGLSAVIARGYATPLDRFIRQAESRPAPRMPDAAA